MIVSNCERLQFYNILSIDNKKISESILDWFCLEAIKLWFLIYGFFIDIFPENWLEIEFNVKYNSDRFIKLNIKLYFSTNFCYWFARGKAPASGASSRRIS